MTRTTTVLLGALGVQALLAVATWWPRDSGTVEAAPLVELEADAVTRVIVEGPGDDAEPLELVKEGEAWSIASSVGYPAQPDKVQDLIHQLLDIEVRRPVATKAVNHDTLNVGAKEWGKKVQLETGDASVEIVIGAASGRASYVRIAGEDEVYAARDLSEWSIKDRPTSYWDAEVVSLDVDSATAVTIAKRDGTVIELASGDGGWLFEGEVPEGEMIDPDKIDRLASAACKLRLRTPVGTEALPEHGLEPAAAVVTVTLEGEEEEGATSTYSYSLGNTLEGEVYLQTPDSPFVVTVSEYTAKDLTEASVEGLLLSLDEEPEPSGMGGMGGMGGMQGLPPGLDLSGLGL